MAESATLRSKSADFKYGLSAASMDVGENEKIVRGLEKAAWYTLLRNVQPPALKHKPTTPLQLLTQTPRSRTSTQVDAGLHRGRRHTLYEEKLPVFAGLPHSQSSAISFISSEPQSSWDSQGYRVREHPKSPLQVDMARDLGSPVEGPAGAPQIATAECLHLTNQQYNNTPRAIDLEPPSSTVGFPKSPTDNLGWLNGDFTYDVSPVSKRSTSQTQPHHDSASLIVRGRQGPPLLHGTDFCSLDPQEINCYPKATEEGSLFPLPLQTDSVDIVSSHHAMATSRQEIGIMDYNKLGSFQGLLRPPIVDQGVNQDFNLNM